VTNSNLHRILHRFKISLIIGRIFAVDIRVVFNSIGLHP